MTTIAELNEALKDRYLVEKEIGQGGMATVFLARDLRHNRAVALKVLPAELSAVIGSERFLREIDVTANLQHPHILPLFDSGTAGGQLFYVMPFIEGETLRTRLERERQLPVADAVRIATEVADALAYAHKRNVIHRDIKPENILLQDGHALVADFGIALAVSNAAGERATQTGVSLGTPQYMSPEQAAGERTVDGRSDIYSLAAVTYEMLAGEPPHRGNSVQATLAKVMTTPPQPLRAMRSTVPANVAHAVEKALAKLPADRFSSAEEFADALANPAYAASTAIEPARSGGWRYGMAPALTATAVVLLVAALWGWLRPAPAPTVVRYELTPDASDAMSAAVRNTRLALSPDGSKLVYVGARNTDLLVRTRDQLVAAPLQGTEGAGAPAFSPDGDRVAFISGHTIKVSSIEGGTPITVTDALGSPNAVSWGPDKFLYTDDIGHGLQRVAPVAGAAVAPFTQLDTAAGEVTHVWPDALPGGRGVLFTIAYGPRAIAKTGVVGAIAVEDAASHTHRVLIERAFGGRYVATGHLIYKTSGGELMVVPFNERTLKVTGEARHLTEKVRTSKSGAAEFTVSSTGRLVYVTGGGSREMELVWVARDGKTQPIDSTWHSNFSAPAISPDGARVAVGVLKNDMQDIWIKQLNGGPAVNLTLDGKYNVNARWTPDGRSVTYQSLAGGSTDLWTKRADGSATATLQLHQPMAIEVGVWSHDGSWLIFGTSLRMAGSGDILANRPGRDSAATVVAATKFEEASPSLSPDGRWLAYSSNETGRREVYVVPFPSVHSARWAVSEQGGAEPLWSHRGSELYYRNGNGEMVAAEVRTTPTFGVIKSTVLFSAREFHVAFAEQEYDVSPDDRRFLMIRPIASTAPDKIIVVENWFEELKAMNRPKK